MEFKSPDPAAASPERSCPRVVGHLGRASAYGQRQSQRRQSVLGRLTGRATSLPFTTVLTGPGRTITDNTEAAWVYRSRPPSRSLSRSWGRWRVIWASSGRGHGGDAVSAASRWGLVAAA